MRNQYIQKRVLKALDLSIRVKQDVKSQRAILILDTLISKKVTKNQQTFLNKLQLVVSDDKLRQATM